MAASLWLCASRPQHRRVQRRLLHAFADSWALAHEKAIRGGRAGWPRPDSPLASMLGQSAEDGWQREHELAAAALARRLPPVDSATTFESYLKAVGASDSAGAVAGESMAEQIRREAAERRASRGVPELPRAGPIIEEEADEDAHLPAGRFDAAIEHRAQRHDAKPEPGLSSTASLRRSEPPAVRRMRQAIREFKLVPREVKAHLDAHVIGQDAAKRALAVAVCDHYNFVRSCMASPELGERHHMKPNVLLLGPSGVGKTHLIRALARLLGVPFAKADATKFSATGYVGGDVDDIVRALLPAAHGEVSLAEFGIVYVDEVDKLAESGGGLLGGGSGGSGVNTKDVQCALLKMMEDAEVAISPATGLAPRPGFASSSRGGATGAAGAKASTLRTRHVLFVFSGAFTKLETSLRRRRSAWQADAGATPEADAAAARERDDVLQLAGTADFVQHGLEPEFIGRIPIRVACRRLREDDLYRVLLEAHDSVAEQMVSAPAP